MKHVCMECCLQVAARIGKDWRMIGRRLGLEEHQLDEIHYKGRESLEEQAVTMFNVWLQRRRTLLRHESDDLYQALSDTGRQDVIEMLEEKKCSRISQQRRTEEVDNELEENSEEANVIQCDKGRSESEVSQNRLLVAGVAPTSTVVLSCNVNCCIIL